MPKYQCVQYSICPRADACEEIEIKLGDSFQCGRTPADLKCREQLIEVRGNLSPKLKSALVAVPIAALLGVGAWMLIGSSKGDGKRQPQANVEQLLTDVWPWLKNTQ